MPGPPSPAFGRVLAFAGIILVALNLRSAAVAIFPVAGFIARELPIGVGELGLLGALAPLAFAVSGLAAPAAARRWGMERVLLISCIVMAAGQILRAISVGLLGVVAASVVVLVGIGVGNVLLPPAVKKYFPRRIGLVTACYSVMLSVSAAVPSIVVVPLAESYGWRISIGVWAATAVIAMVPWLLLLLRPSLFPVDAAVTLPAPASRLFGSVWKSRTARGITLAFGVSAFTAFTTIAILPALLQEQTGISDLGAGALLALFVGMGLPVSLTVPIVVARLRNAGVLFLVANGLFVAGYAGLLFIPGLATWLWVVLIGVAQLMFPACLALIGLRSRSEATAAAVSGFAHAVGYAFAAIGPPLVAVAYALFGGWHGPLWLLLGVSLLAVPAGFMLGGRAYIDDEISRSSDA